MTTAMDSTAHKLLFEEDSACSQRRDTLLLIWELSDQIAREMISTFETRIRARFEEEKIQGEPSKGGGLNKENWGWIEGPRAELAEDGMRAEAYAAIQRCPPGYHRLAEPHFIIGIKIDDPDDQKDPTRLRRWRQRMLDSGIGEGTGDKYWVWQKVPEGFKNLRSRDTATKLLDPNSADEIVKRIQGAWKLFIECAATQGAVAPSQSAVE